MTPRNALRLSLAALLLPLLLPLLGFAASRANSGALFVLAMLLGVVCAAVAALVVAIVALARTRGAAEGRGRAWPAAAHGRPRPEAFARARGEVVVLFCARVAALLSDDASLAA
jgi:hypothetical protein